MLVVLGGSDTPHVLREPTAIPSGSEEPAGLVAADMDGAHRPPGGYAERVIHLDET
jgi:hypothetical protein